MKGNQDASYEMQKLNDDKAKNYLYLSPDGKKENDKQKNLFTPKTLNEGQISELVELIEQKVQEYDPAAEGQDANAEFHGTEGISFYKMISRHADCRDYILLIIGSTAATAFGAALPAFCLLFGNMIDGLGQGASTGGSTSNSTSELNSTQTAVAQLDTTQSFKQLETQSLYQVYIGLGVAAASWCLISLFALFAESISFKTKILYFEKCLEKDAAFYDKISPTEMASRISKECSAIARGLGEKVGNTITAVASFFFGFIFAFYWGWLLTCILLAGFPIIIATGVSLGVSLQSGFVEAMKSYSQSAGYAEQALQAIKVVHTYGREQLELKNYSKYLTNARETASKQTMRSAMGQGLMFLNIFLFYAFGLYFGGYLRYNQVQNVGGKLYSSGAIIAIMFSVIFGSFNLGGAGPHIKSISEAKIAGKMAYDVIDAIPDVDPQSQGQSVQKDQIFGRITFENVNFTYPTRPELPILKDFSCVFEAGKTTALVGPSGSGKSTIIQMIERFYNPTSGKIRVDNIGIEKLNLRELRRIIGYVGQEPVLFNTSIRENMLFAKPDATEEEIIEALQAANAWDFIRNNMAEKGLDTMVGGAGGQLSGGQKQRIAIARAFLKKPRILLLDEATSALDKVNEKAVQDAIDNYRKTNGNITIIVIAHRLSTIVDADKIVVLKNGVLVEIGNHQELLRNYPDGVYHNFCKKQESAEGKQVANVQNQSVSFDADEDPASERGNYKKKSAQNYQIEQTPQTKKEVADNYDTNAKLVDKERVIIIDTAQVAKEVDPLVIQKLQEANELDQKAIEEQDKIMEEHGKISSFKKIYQYNEPKFLIIVAIFMSAISGASQPIFGVIFSKVMNLLTVPLAYIPFIYGYDFNMQDQMNKYCLGTFFIAISCFISMSLQKYCFGTLGENVTLKIRKVLYGAILQKEIGFHDFRENGTSVLTSAMAQESSLINGVSTESIGPQVEAFFAVFVGLGIGFGFCWQESLLCLALAPFMTIGQALGMEFQKGITNESGESNKEANLLCGDAIVNYKTVQSFGNEILLVQKYKQYLIPQYLITCKGHIKAGFAFGLSQCTIYLIFSAIFYGGSLIIRYSYDPATGTYGISSENIFIAMFAIFFGASQAGTSASLGPDVTKAKAAAEKIFKIIETPSKINAVEMESNKCLLQAENVKGLIEFKNVWFRYPTRKEDFVLKGFNITINPCETVALVGESGCGKSTFVNLMMRFYDVDFGEILLDGRNIKDYDLHQLRTAISLVMQEPIIFNYSILENILYGKIDATNSEIINAAEVANCTEFIQQQNVFKFENTAGSLLKEMEENQEAVVKIIGKKKFDEELDVLKKMKAIEDQKGLFKYIQGDVDERDDSLRDVELDHGYGTQCGIKGGKLSGGQKQRVAIARAIIRKPKVLLLDEATSALDEDSQKKVQQALESAMKNRTVIIIAHRMSTIEKCDKIFVLEEGKVIEEGGFNELKTKGGLFSKLSQNKQN